MKKYLLVFLSIFCISLFVDCYIYAATETEVEVINETETITEEETHECNIELSEALENKTLSYISCHETYSEAKKVMDETNNDNLVIVENGIIIDAKYALIDFDIAYPSSHKGYIYVYSTATSTSTNYYIRSSTPDDAAVIEYNYDAKRIKVKIAGLTGWIKEYDDDLKLYEVVPLIWAKTPHYYQVTETKLTHYFPGNLYDKKGTSYTIDQKPSMLDVGTYYSYDGHYFYTSMKELLQDYKNGNYNQAVNKTNPYYNYYQYVSFRTKTNHEIENIDLYLSKRTSDSSKMRQTAEYFVDVQNKYGVNAILMMAIGMNESGKGTSDIAKNKNNLFGLNAIDQSPGQSADYFETIEDCINDYGYAWLSYGFLQPGDYRFNGANLGNKAVGLNYRYASDPYWAEKAAHYYYDLDSMFGFIDYNSYQLAVLNSNYSNKVYPKKTVNGLNVSSKYYQYKVKGSPVIVLEEVDGWYKIQSDPTLDSNLEYIGSSTSNPRITYDWDNNIVYVKASYFTKINESVNDIPSTGSNNNTEDKDEPEAKKISLIIKDANYKYKDSTIYGINPETSVKDIKTNLTNAGGTIKITDSSGNTKKEGNISTGDKVEITSGTTEIFNVVINGDLTGDGKINSADLLRMRQHLLGTELTGVYKEAGYMGYDKINSANLLKLRQYLLGQVEIEQK